MKQTKNLKDEQGADILTVPAMLLERVRLTAAAPAQMYLSSGNTWSATSWNEYFDVVTRIACSLRELGLSPGDRIGIMAPSSPQWDAIQIGILTARGVVVGMDVHEREDNLNAIAKRCGLAGLIVHDPAWLGRLKEEITDALKFVIGLQLTQDPIVKTLDDLIGVSNFAEDPGWQSALIDEVKPDDPATIIFTSGTTGAPKGIQYTHRQLCLAVSSITCSFSGIGVGSRLICWLPLSNLFQRIINMCAISCGARTYYVEDPRSVMQHLRLIKPHLFIAVPRFYEKLYVAMMENLSERSAWQHVIISWCLRAGERYFGVLNSGAMPNQMQKLQYALADWTVLRHLRALMGLGLCHLVSGSAQMPQWLLYRFQAMGLLIFEAYGLSENVIPIAANCPHAYQLGTVGRVMPGNQVRVADDSELWVRGPGVFNGYFGEESETGATDAEGYLPTGDYAAIDADGFITLTGRKSEVFKTSTGRKVAPVAIESSLRQVPYVEHAVVFGSARPFLVAVLAVGRETLQSCSDGEASLYGCQAACEGIRRDIAKALGSLPHYKRPAGAILTSKPFTIESGDLTLNLKLRRTNVEAAYYKFIDKLYCLLAASSGEPFQMDCDGGSIILCSL